MSASTGFSTARTGEPKPTICLSMIVRDEADVVLETLEAVVTHIDHWVIVDTGSVDATVDVVRSFMAENDVPGEILERRWRNFGHNRTEALEACRGKADYIWMIDADDLVVGDLDLGGLRADSYLLRYGEDFRYWRKQIFRDGLRWRYKGVVHEYPVCLDPASEERLEGDYHVVSRRVGARSRHPRKYERDAELLREIVERESADLARSVFYLAQSHYDAGDPEQALEWYTRRAEMGGWGEEVFYSLLRRGACLEQSGEPWSSVLEAYLNAWEARPTRAEPLYEIAHHYRLDDRFDLGYLFAKRAAAIPYPEEDTLFVAADVYGWRAADELAISAYYMGRYEESFELSTKLLESETLPAAERARVAENRGFCVRWIEEERAEYPAELVERISQRVGSDAADAEVTLTITSCRRPALFEKTVNSFLRCCTDSDRIGRWICVDNGSDEADRSRMRERYPFFEFLYTDPAVEGHPESLNRLREEVKSPFWLHLEDDWHFFWRGPYVERALAILGDDPAIAQVAFNRNYEETIEQPVHGGEPRRTAAEGLPYRLHRYLQDDSRAWREYLESLRPGEVTNTYWPHFTLRPSLMRTEAVRQLEPFRSEAGHFEREFADRYAKAGLKTAFFDTINCFHTGRLTSGKDGDGRVSAYELVGDREHPAHPGAAEMPGLPDESLPVTVINLDRRPDRWESFWARMISVVGSAFDERISRFSAVDGRELVETEEIRWLFRGNDFALRRGFVGCALSHIAIWRSIAERGDDALELVLEDDAQPCPRFDRLLARAASELRTVHREFDLAFLGCTRLQPEPPASGQPDGEAPRGPLLREMRWQNCVGGLFAYLISGRGARRLLALVERDGVQNGIDRFVCEQREELRVLECDPPLAETPVAFAGDDVDSDIQHDFAPVAQAVDPGGEMEAPDAAVAPGTTSDQLTMGRGSYQEPTVVSYLGDRGRVTVGAFCSIANDVKVFLGGNHRVDWLSTYPLRFKFGLPGALEDGHPTSKGDVFIGNDVWIGAGATILSGVRIGDGAVVGAGSLVARDVPDYTIVAGNPAREVRRRFAEDEIEALKRIRWWDWPEDQILAAAPLLNGGGIEEFIARFDPGEESASRPGRSATAGTRTLARLLPGVELGELRLDVEPAWACSGASIAAAGEQGFRAIVRTAEAMDDGPALNYLVSLGANFELESVDFVAPRAADRWYDGCRLLRIGERWVVSALERASSGAAHSVLLRLDGATVATVEQVALEGTRLAPPPPFAADAALRLVGSWSPLRILDPHSSGEAVAAGRAAAIAGSFFDASAGLAIEEGWLFAVRDADSRAHRLALLDRDSALSAASPPFTIAGLDDESCWGLARRNGELVLSFGAGERAAAGLAVLPLEPALGLLEPCR